MRVEIRDGVGAPWPMTARGIPAIDALLPALSMVIVKVELHTGTTHIGTHRRVELGESDVNALDKGEATEDAVDHSAEGEGITQGKRLLFTIKPDGAISLQTWPNAARDGHIFPLGASHHEGDDILSNSHIYHLPRQSHL